MTQTSRRSKGTLDNYLENRFKLDGNLYCLNAKVKNELQLINQIHKENEEAIFEVNFKELLWQYEHMENFSNDTEDSEEGQQCQYETTNKFRNRMTAHEEDEDGVRRGSPSLQNVTRYN